MMSAVLGEPLKHRPRHLRYYPRINRWLILVTLLLLATGSALARFRPHLVWWVILGLVVFRVAFSAVNRWNNARAADRWQRWRDSHDAN